MYNNRRYAVVINIPIILISVMVGWSSHNPRRHMYSPMKFIDPGVLIWANLVIIVRVDRIGVVSLVPWWFLISRVLCRSYNKEVKMKRAGLVSPCLIISSSDPFLLILLREKIAAVIIPICAIEEYAIIRFMSFCRSLFNLADHSLSIPIIIISGDKNLVVRGRMGVVNRINP